MRTPTNTLLVAMAVSDTLTGLSPIPGYLYFYTWGRGYEDYVPYHWCFLYFCLSDHLPTIFHTASVWLTVALGVQRYWLLCLAVFVLFHFVAFNDFSIVITIFL